MAEPVRHSDEADALRRDLADAREELAATRDVLTALSGRGSHVDGVLGSIVDIARRLGRADAAHLYLVDGDSYRLARSSGLSDEVRDYIQRNPFVRDRGTLIGRIGLDRTTQQIADVLDDPTYGRFDAQRLAGYRTTVGAPMLLDDEVVGALLLWRSHVDPFDERSCDMLSAFAAQAALAIRTVDLVRTLEERTAELAGKVDQLEALTEVGQAVGSSLDVDEVLRLIVMHAAQLSGADGGSVMEYDEEARSFRVRAAYQTSEEVLHALREARIGLDDTLVGRAAGERRPIKVDDIRHEPPDPHLDVLAAAGWRSLIAVPMLREGRIVGALVVRRRSVGGFSPEVRDLLETFAGQSALALVNARLYRELELKGRELEVASRHKSEFLASMSHELRTPLNAVIGFSEVLLERMFGELNERQDEYLRDILDSGKHLLELLNEILDLSKVEAGQMVLDVQSVDLRGVLEHSLAFVRERAARHAITLSLHVGEGAETVEADELRLKQVVMNLLSNAVKFTPDGGRVEVTAGATDDEVVVSVRDSGVGVAPQDRERIFESFQQGSRGTPAQEGTGLGLTLSRRIVQLHEGRLWLDSEVGQGSTFAFSLPRRSRRRGSPAAVVDGDRPLVVVIEDDDRSMELLRLHLTSIGVRVETASDGEQGLELVRSAAPDAVVLDIVLPKLDGWDLLARLKSDAVTAEIPVVIVSMLDERGRGFALGAVDYLIKPVSHERLHTALQRAAVVEGIGVVVIDPDERSRLQLQAALDRSGWRVHTAADSDSGLALVRAKSPGAVLVALELPDMGGLDVIDALRADRVTGAVPILVVTPESLTDEQRARLHERMAYVARRAELTPARLDEVLSAAVRTASSASGRTA